jgi:hypothetical protein
MAREVPSIPIGLDAQTRNFFSALREAVNEFTVNGGSNAESLNSNITADNLTGLVDSLDSLLDTTSPPIPTGVVVTGVFSSILVTWNKPNYASVAFAEIWRANALDTAGLLIPPTGSNANGHSINFGTDARLVGTSNGQVFTDSVTPGSQYYYWLRFLSMANNAGPYNAQAGIIGATSQTIAELMSANGWALETNALIDGLITANKIADFAVTNAKVANAAITNAKIANLAVSTAQIQDVAVTDAKIQSLAVEKLVATTAWLATADILDGSITNAKILNGAVTNAKIADAQITTAKIADTQITTAKIANAAITNAKIGDLAVDSLQIRGNAVSYVSRASANTLTINTHGTLAYPTTLIVIGKQVCQSINAISTLHLEIGGVDYDTSTLGTPSNVWVSVVVETIINITTTGPLTVRVYQSGTTYNASPVICAVEMMK